MDRDPVNPFVAAVRRCSPLGAVLLVFSACGGGDGPSSPPAPVPASLVITATVDTVGAVGSTLPLTAQARTSSGVAITGAVFSWVSSAPGTASVSQSGVVSFLTEGNVVITAATGSVSGTISMRGTLTDLAGVQGTLGDAFVTSLIGALTATPRGSVTTANAACASAQASGSLTGVRNCLTALLNVSASGQPDDTALLAVLALFWQQAQRLLHFTS